MIASPAFPLFPAQAPLTLPVSFPIRSTNREHR